jgi:hypothetical protein
VEIDEITGQKYSANGIFFSELYKSFNGITFHTIDGPESVPSPLLDWVALDTREDIALSLISGTQKVYYLQLYSIGYTGTVGTQQNGVEYGYVSLGLDPDQVPMVSMASLEESENLSINSVISNAATGFSLQISLSLRFDAYVVVDTKNKKITLYDGSNQINAMQDFAIRQEWFPLLPGRENEITITDPGQASYQFDWEDRAL